MHNKIIVADGHFAIVGGRNIGDRYFGLWEEFVQNDLDVLAAGRIVGDVARGFDDYWNSALSYPLDRVISKRAQAAELDEMREFIESFYRAESRKLNYFPLEPVSWKSFLEAIEESAAPGSGRLVQDLPSVQHDRPVQLVEPLNEFVGRAEKRVLVSSPYLIPDDEFFAILEALEARGVEVVILTNSLASNNHMIAHAAYMPWRKRFLRAGMDLFESRDDSPMIEYYSTPPVEPAFLGLHSKAIVVDDRYSYIGSANIDPRSLIMNTELAMFMDSPELATRLTELIERDLSPEAAWRVTLNDRGKLRWTSSAGTVSKQPALGFGQRLAHFFIRMLPIRSQA